MKTFSLDEAQSLLPVLESLLRRALTAKAKAEELEGEMQQLSQRIFLAGGMQVPIARVVAQRNALQTAVQEIRDTVREIDAIGVEVKDLNSGLLDFPCRIGEETVLLCWKLGEPEIAHWHAMDAGFAGRQPLDYRFRRSGERPN